MSGELWASSEFEMTSKQVCFGLLGSFVMMAMTFASGTTVRRTVIVNETSVTVPFCSRLEQLYLPNHGNVARCPTPDELFLDEEVIPNDSEVYGPPSSMPWLPSPLSIKLVRPPTRDVFQMISNSFAMLIFLYVIYVIPLIASSDDDQTFRFDFDSHPYSSLYDQAYYTSSTM